MTSTPWAAVAVGSSALLLGLGGLMVRQHLAHGWPFSLHHGVPTSAVAGERPPPPAQAEARVPVRLDPSRADAVGIRTEPVRRETIGQPIRAVATVVPDESRLSHVHPKVAGWVEKLHVRTTGERVRAGQALAGIFSQELLSSQAELLAARRAAQGAPKSIVADAARSRLAVLGMSEAEIRRIEEAGRPERLVTIVAPRSGVVLSRGVTVGAAVDPSTELLTIADLSRVWVLAEIPEPEIRAVSVGMTVHLEFPASGREAFESRVDFVHPTLSERTRTLRVRMVVDNRDGVLRPGLFGRASFHPPPRSGLTVARDAVVDSGDSQHVFVALDDGRFEPRAVKLGARLGDRMEIREGLAEGAVVVASGVFLIDSESRLRASGLAHQHHAASPAGSAGAPSSPPASAAPAPPAPAPAIHRH